MTAEPPTASDALTHASSNLAIFLERATERCGPATTIDDVRPARDPGGDVASTRYPRFGFTVTVNLAEAETPTTFKVVMPGAPLDQVNYGVREEDEVWEFPRLMVTAATPPVQLAPANATWWWPFGIEMVTSVLDAVADGQHHPSLVATRLLLRQHTNGRGLGWGYNPGLPIDPFLAAWGCRAIVKQSGYLDIPPDRKSSLGEKTALKQLFAKLDGGLMDKWKTRARELLSDYEMRTSESGEFTLLSEDGVVVKANTQGSYGYLYVCAATPAHEKDAR